MPYSHFLPSYSGVAYFFVYEGLEEHPDGSRWDVHILKRSRCMRSGN